MRVACQDILVPYHWRRHGLALGVIDLYNRWWCLAQELCVMELMPADFITTLTKEVILRTSKLNITKADKMLFILKRAMQKPQKLQIQESPTFSKDRAATSCKSFY